MDSLDEWGLGGRGFGTIIPWFLLGGDLYTAYTFVAVPAAMFATGAVSGFFAVPYTIVAYPIVFVFLPRLWSVAQRRGDVPPAAFVRRPFGRPRPPPPPPPPRAPPPLPRHPPATPRTPPRAPP